MSGYLDLDSAIEEVRSRVDIAELISQRVQLKRSGADFKACCPFHHEKTPSFIVSSSRRTFHCFGCGAHGDVFKFLMLFDGLTFIESVKTLAATCGVEIEERKDPRFEKRKTLIHIHEELASFFQRCLEKLDEAKIARDYLASRKINAETIKNFRLGYVPEGNHVIEEWVRRHNFNIEDLVEGGIVSPPHDNYSDSGYYNKFHGRLAFPICDQAGKVVAFSCRILTDDKKTAKYYNSPETPIFQKSRVLYGLSFAKKSITKRPERDVLICEGQIDVIRCHASGFDNAVASQGTAFTEEHVSLLKPYCDKAVLVFDGDAAGRKAAVRTGRLFLTAGIPVTVATLPKGEDPDSILRDKGIEAFQNILNKASSLAQYQIVAMQSEEEDPNAYDAVARITAELYETFYVCSKEVLRARLIQESAELLNLPQEAIESDYKAYTDRRDNLKKWQAGRSAGSTAQSRQTQPGGGHAAKTESHEENGAIGTEATAHPKPTRRIYIDTPLISIADTLLKLSTIPNDENLALVNFISAHLPDEIIGTGPEGAVIRAAIADRYDGGDRLAALAVSPDEEESIFVDYISRRPSPILSSDQPLSESMKELVYRAWIAYLKKLSEETDRETSEGSTLRLMYKALVRKLESKHTWDERLTILCEHDLIARQQ